MKLNPLAAGLAGGILWGGGIFLVMLFSRYTGYGQAFINLVDSTYPGSSTGSFTGMIIGGVWGFVDAFIGGILFVVLYNLFVDCQNKKKAV